jgi:phage/plasmid-associated DNA primase
MLIREEGPGILNWCVQGAQRLFKNIHNSSGNGKIPLSARQQKFVDDLLAQSDSLRIFLKQKVAATTQDGSDLSSEELFQTYLEFTQANGWDALPLSMFNKRLPDQMAVIFGSIHATVRRDGRQVRGYKQVRLRAPDDEIYQD